MRWNKAKAIFGRRSYVRRLAYSYGVGASDPQDGRSNDQKLRDYVENTVAWITEKPLTRDSLSICERALVTTLQQMGEKSSSEDNVFIHVFYAPSEAPADWTERGSGVHASAGSSVRDMIQAVLGGGDRVIVAVVVVHQTTHIGVGENYDIYLPPEDDSHLDWLRSFRT